MADEKGNQENSKPGQQEEKGIQNSRELGQQEERASQGHRVQTLWTSFLQQWGEPLGLLMSCLAFVVTFVSGWWRGWELVQIVFALLCVVLIALVFWFLYIFTGNAGKKLNRMIVFCYIFTILCVLSPVFLFLAFASGSLGQYEKMIKSPIGMVIGCSATLPGGRQKEVGSQEASEWSAKELECESTTSQWVIYIGGTIKEAWEVPTPQQSDKKALWKVGTFQQPEQRSEESRFPVHIQGGLVVPIYIGVLALMGGAVSMTRRVPEYQRRAMAPDDPVTPENARECLVFQIMQVISAPLIAITAYHLIGPTTRAISVALGFASGFASETILLGIGAFVKKLQPEKPTSESKNAPKP